MTYPLGQEKEFNAQIPVFGNVNNAVDVGYGRNLVRC